MDAKKRNACKLVVCDIVDPVRDALVDRLVPQGKEEFIKVYNHFRGKFLKQRCGNPINRFLLGYALFCVSISRLGISFNHYDQAFEMAKEMALQYYGPKWKARYKREIMTESSARRLIKRIYDAVETQFVSTHPIDAGRLIDEFDDGALGKVKVVQLDRPYIVKDGWPCHAKQMVVVNVTGEKLARERTPVWANKSIMECDVVVDMDRDVTKESIFAAHEWFKMLLDNSDGMPMIVSTPSVVFICVSRE